MEEGEGGEEMEERGGMRGGGGMRRWRRDEGRGMTPMEGT